MAIVGLMYHTADKKTFPEDKSFYRYEVMVKKIDDVKAMIAEMNKDENRLNTWQWGNDTWDKNHFMEYTKFNDNAHGAKFFKNCVNKMLTWEAYVKKVRDGISYVSIDKKEKYTPSAKYDVEGYEDKDGNKNISIVDKETLLSYVDKFVWKNIPLKRTLV
jgi:hypothetical protein